MVGTIEDTYGISLNARRDMLLGNLLEERGFDSLSQLLKAYHGNLDFHPTRRRLFLSFAVEDKPRVNGFRLMAMNPRVELDFYDLSVRTPIDSHDAGYIKQVIQEKVRGASVLVCLIGNGTASSDWVEWEVQKAKAMRKGICGIRLKGTHGRTPPFLRGFCVVSWDLEQITRVIEWAAARRS